MSFFIQVFHHTSNKTQDRETLEYLARRNGTPISKEDGEKLAKEIKADFYMECSAKDLQSVDAVFEKIILRGIQHRESKKQTNSPTKRGFFK